MDRNELIRTALEKMNLAKRSMSGSFQRLSTDSQLSSSQLELLLAIQMHQPVTSKVLATERHLTPGSISQITDTLVQKGYIERQMDPLDRRAHSLKLSSKGAKQLKSIHKRREEFFKRVMRNLTDHEIEVWLHVQDKFIQELEIEKSKSIHKGK